MIPMTDNMFLFGIIEDIMDPLQYGRVRVRYLKIHTDNKTKLPTELLPWSQVIGSIYSASISGVGVSPVGMVPGTMVFAIPIDQGMQEFLILGTIAGNRTIYLNPSFGFNDPSGLYPKAGIQGDINRLARDNANTGDSVSSANTIVKDVIASDIPAAKDPTLPPKVLDPEAYKDTPWMSLAQTQLGINELDNADKVREYHTIGGGQTREPTVAWCSSFCNYCLLKTSIKGTRSAASRSFINYGKSVGTTNVPFGAIAVFGVPNSGSGHVAFVLQDKGDKLVVLGGNQSDKSHRSGGQVSKTTIPKNSSSLVLLDCRFPTSLQSNS
jgi:uncharacterized protein (TIGR02594 family)